MTVSVRTVSPCAKAAAICFFGATLVFPAAHAQRTVDHACSAVQRANKRVELASGATVTINVKTVATSFEATVIAGTPTLVWRPPTRATGLEAPDSTSLGVMRTRRATYTTIPAPSVNGVLLRNPRFVSDGSQGWHAVLVLPSTEEVGARDGGRAIPTLWYGHYSRRGWTLLQRVASLSGATLAPEFTSALLSNRAGLWFAFPFEDSSLGRGIALLRHHNARWTRHDLQTWEKPRSVALANTSDGTVTGFFSQASVDAGKLRQSSVYSARFDTTWHERRLLVEDASGGILTSPLLSLEQLPPRALVWRRRGLDGPAERLEVAGLRSEVLRNPVVRIGSVTGVLGGPFVASLGSSLGTAIVTKAAGVENALEVFLFRGSVLTSAGVINVPYDRFSLYGWTGDPRGFWIVSNDGTPLAQGGAPATYVTRVNVTCR
jgi:hypothetical protein